MILNALMEYYQRKELPPIGFDNQEIPFIIVIDGSGKFINLEDTRENQGIRPRAKQFKIPMGKERSGKNAWQTANIMWDHIGYVLGHPKEDTSEAKERANNQHKSFVSETEKVVTAFPKEIEFSAVLTFINSESFPQIISHPNWQEAIRIPGCNISFRVAGNSKTVGENPLLFEYVQASVMTETLNDDKSPTTEYFSHCILTGNHSKIARLQPTSPLPSKKSKSNAKIVSFQKNCGYDSYGKEQSSNAPISIPAAGAYGMALNHLLGSRQRLPIGEDTILFWSKKPDDLENQLLDIFGEPQKDDTNRNTEAVHNLYQSVKTGSFSTNDRDKNLFYILGLTPNAARISVRFWQVLTVRELADNIKQHFDDFTLEGSQRHNEYPSLQGLLKAITRTSGKHPYGNYEDIAPNLSGDTLNAILKNLPYPDTLFGHALRRIKAEGSIPPHGDKQHGSRLWIDQLRFTIIKACINRKIRYSNPTIKEELKMALDESNKNSGYRLGRLFAVLEKIQAESHPGLNATIRDRYYGAASGTPVTVFSILMRMKNHHVAKLENKGRAVNFEKMITEIMDGITDFPAHLTLDDQGRFSIGYYHQTQKFYQKTSKEGEE